MQILRVTGKLQQEMNLRPEDLSEHLSTTLLGDWYAHLFSCGRKKCVIFLNTKSLLSFVLTRLKKSEVLALDQLFRHGFCRLFASLGMAAQELEQLSAEIQSIAYGKPANREVIGAMNDLIFHAKVEIERLGGPEAANLTEVNQALNQVPHSFRNGKNGLELGSKILDFPLKRQAEVFRLADYRKK